MLLLALPLFQLVCGAPEEADKLGVEDEDNGDGGGELGPHEPQEVLHVRPGIREQQEATGMEKREEEGE